MTARRPAVAADARAREAALVRATRHVAFLAAAALVSIPLAAQQRRPIIETHIHVYQVTRPGGVPWPKPGNQVLYRDVLPAEYRTLARKQGVIAAGIMEASPLFEDNLKVAALIEGDPFFTFYVAQLEIGSPDFARQLAQLVKSPKCVGIRGFLWSPKLTLEARQLADLKELARQGMTLDLISRGTLNPKDQVAALAAAVPDLRIVVDHLGGAKGEKVDPAWEAGIRKLAAHPNVFMKLSSLFDMFNPRSTEDQPWTSPQALAAYKPHLDVLMDAFGPDRLIFGSNWPVVNLGGSIEKEIALAEAWLRPLGTAVRDKVMYQNAQKFYRRLPPAR
jgi:predicted TIM-barrel fold metal-dependent hydrolase